MQRDILCTFVATLVIAFAPAIADEDNDKEFNNGEDITRPLTRTDAKIKFQQGDNGRESRAYIATLRTDKSILLSNDWQIGLRADLPYEWYHCSNTSNCGLSLDHLGDTLAQAFLIPPSFGKWTWGYGLQVIFPTAGNNLQIGQGKYQLLPSFAIKYSLDDWSSGSYLGLILRETFSVAGYDSAPYVSQTYIQPFFNVILPDQWFLTMSPELRYNWRIKRWFVPFDILIGKMITPNVVVSLEYENAIVYDYKRFTQEVEFRIGFFY